MIKKIIALLCAYCLLHMQVTAYAEGSASVVAGRVSTYSGYSVSVDITAENFENIGAIDIDVFYDPEALVLDSATKGISDVTFCINDDAEGTVRLSLASHRGITGTLVIATLNFTVSAEAETGEYPINIAIGDAFNTELEEVSVARYAGTVTVLEKPVSIPTARFYCSTNKSSFEAGEEVILTYYSYTLHGLASGIFEIYYDETLFEFVSFDLCDGMETEDGIVSVNSSFAGYIKAAYNSSAAVQTGDLFSITLRVIKDADASTSVKMTAKSLYAEDLSIINGNDRSTTLSIMKKAVAPEPSEPESKSFGVYVPERISEDEEFEAAVRISGDSALAAGDFVISYNTDELECVSVKAHQAVAENNGMVVINKNISEGTVKFSYINENGVSKTHDIIVIVLRPIKTGFYSSKIECSGSGLRDANFKVIELDFVSAEIKIGSSMLKGDVNFDGKINIIDANLIRRNTVKLTEFSDAQIEAGDVDGNGRINIADANLVRRYAAKLIDSFPAG